MTKSVLEIASLEDAICLLEGLKMNLESSIIGQLNYQEDYFLLNVSDSVIKSVTETEEEVLETVYPNFVTSLSDAIKLTNVMLSQKMATKCLSMYIAYNLLNDSVEALQFLTIPAQNKFLLLEEECFKVLQWLKSKNNITDINYGDLNDLPKDEIEDRENLLRTFTDKTIPKNFIYNTDRMSPASNVISATPKLTDCTAEEIFVFQILIYLRSILVKFAKEHEGIESKTIDQIPIKDAMLLHEASLIFRHLNRRLWGGISKRVSLGNDGLVLAKDWAIYLDPNPGPTFTLF